MSMRRRQFLVLLFTMLAGSPLSAVTIRVPTEQPTIVAGIGAAHDGDTVLVLPGTYSGSGNDRIGFLGKKITIRSEKGPDSTIILTTDTVRTFYINAEEDSASILEGFTISGGYENDFSWENDFRGGIHVSTSSPVIRDCIIRGCYNEDGGGILLEGGRTRIIGCRIIGNRASHRGGGVFTAGEITIIDSSIISNNEIGQLGESWLASGGGIRALGGLEIRNSIISRNRVRKISAAAPFSQTPPSQGGGIYALTAGLTINDCLISRNFADIGGAVVSGLADLTVTHTLFFNNTAEIYAGISHLVSEDLPPTSLELNRCTFACNFAARIGSDGLAIISPFSLSEPGDTSYPDSLFTPSPTPAGSETSIISNNVFAFNSSTPLFIETNGTAYSITNNDMWQTVSGPHYGGNLEDLTGRNGNICADPLFCSVSDSGFALDILSPCRGAGGDGGDIGYSAAGCANYAILTPSAYTVALNGGTATANQAVLDQYLADALPWDTLIITSDSPYVPVRQISLTRPLYIIGVRNGDRPFVLAREYSLTDKPTLTVREFCLIDNLPVDGYAEPGNLQGYPAVSVVDIPVIITGSRLRAYGDNSAVSAVAAPLLIRNCSLIGGLTAIGDDNVVASYNYWHCATVACIDSSLRYDSAFFSGIILFQPPLFDEPTGLDQYRPAVLPQEAILFQNYPNPFNGSTVIRYYLPRQADVRLIVYNILGQTVTTLVADTQPAGSYNIVWEATDHQKEPLASGLYIYTLTTGQEMVSRRLLLIK